MNRRIGFALFGLAALAVAAQNWLFFFGGDDPAWGDQDWELGEDGEVPEEHEAVPLPPVTRQAWRTHLDGLADAGFFARSPFASADEAEPGAPGPVRQGAELRPVVTGTMVGERRVAWVDGYPRSEGDRVGRHEIRRIDADAVWFEGRTGRFRVPVSAAAPPASAAGGNDDEDA